LHDRVDNAPDNIENEIASDVLNSEITAEVVTAAVKQLNINKASSGELISAQFVYSIYFLLPYLVRIYNRLFMSGQFPTSWSKSVLVPIHKKGSIHVPDNYRGIALINVANIIYISVLTKRLTFYAEMFNCVNEAQGGFRRGYSTAQ